MKLRRYDGQVRLAMVAVMIINFARSLGDMILILNLPVGPIQWLA